MFRENRRYVKIQFFTEKNTEKKKKKNNEKYVVQKARGHKTIQKER